MDAVEQANPIDEFFAAEHAAKMERLRDEFAKHALQAIILSGRVGAFAEYRLERAREAYGYANAMLEARKWGVRQ